MGIYSASHPDNTYVHNIIIVLYTYMCMYARSTIHMYLFAVCIRCTYVLTVHCIYFVVWQE